MATRIKRKKALNSTGLIPRGWNKVTLEEIASVIDPHPSHRAPAEVKDGIPFVGIGDIDSKGNISLKNVRRVSIDVALEHEKNYGITPGDLGFGRVASIGKVVRLKPHPFKYAISPTMAIIKPHSAYKNLLPFILESDSVQNQFLKIKTGSTRSSVGIQVLRKLELIVPPEKEASRIASILIKAAHIIELTQKLLAAKEKHNRALVEVLLSGKKRVKT